GLKITRRKDKRWSSIDGKQGYWFRDKFRKNKEFQVTVDTTGWPEGDYRMNIQITFQPIVKGENTSIVPENLLLLLKNNLGDRSCAKLVFF
ncbi:MAG: hypothetical protein IKO93_21790, partial [Lentisphaeria bacterium]|nr:hypothetical protein [Lentisphaeria bacterium]